jgi:plastocyanin
MTIRPLRLRTTGVLAAVLILGCGAEDRAAPGPPVIVIAKADSSSGDQQVGVAGHELEQALRAVVTRDDLPAAGVRVYWKTFEGQVFPAGTVTDSDGVSSARWQLLSLLAQQVAVASLDSTGPPGVIFTAIATPDPTAATTILVGQDGNRFEPAELTIAVGQTVNWYWPPGSADHNVVPDDNDSPPKSGAPARYPRFHSYQFTIPGTYRYYCQVHGAPGGVGMSGTITVMTRSCGASC